MQVIPAVDLRDGACVQLVGGSFAEERVRLDDPVDVARRWIEKGFRELHVVDLDAAADKGSNRSLVDEILTLPGAAFQVGGGIRDSSTIEDLLSAGAGRVVVGTQAAEEPGWLESICARFPGRIVLAADARNRSLVTRGWSKTHGRSVTDFICDFRTLDLAAVLVTAVHVEGKMAGPDVRLIEDMISAADGIPVQASGGIGSLSDLRALAEVGANAAITGMALYTGALDVTDILEEFNS